MNALVYALTTTLAPSNPTSELFQCTKSTALVHFNFSNNPTTIDFESFLTFTKLVNKLKMFPPSEAPPVVG
jgi:hypothetical protein